MALSRRIAVLAKRYPHRPPLTPALDVSALTPEEQDELDTILATLEGTPPLPNGRADLSSLSDAELERLAALAERITEKESA